MSPFERVPTTSYSIVIETMTSCFHTMGIMVDGWAWHCVACWHQWMWPLAAAAAHWLTVSAGMLVAVSRPGRALAVWQLDSSAAGDGGAHFAVCFMLVVSCTLGTKSGILCVQSIISPFQAFYVKFFLLFENMLH